MKSSVGLTAVPVEAGASPDLSAAGKILMLQNLGPGALYFDFASNVTATTGLKLDVGGAFELPRVSAETKLYAVADQAATDLRYLVVD